MTAFDQPTSTGAEGANAEGEAATAPTAPAKPTTTLPPEARHWLDLIATVDERIAALEEQRKVARRHLETWLGDHEIGELNGRPVVRWTVVHSTRCDLTKLKENAPEVYRAHLVPGTSRRFTLVKDET